MTLKKALARARHRRIWLLLPVALVLTAYVVICSAGHLGSWPVYMTYYDLLAEGFRSGHLYIPLKPPPALVAAADPFDYANRNLWLPDASLYKGRYYMYWGPVPGLLLALVKTIFRLNHPVGDQMLAFAGFSLAAIFGALIIDRAGRQLFNFVPRWLRGLAILAFGLANPAPHLLASSGIYMACIAFGQAFLFGGLLLAFDAVWLASTRAFDWRLSVAGGLWALAMGSRATMVPIVGLLALLSVLASAWPAPTRMRSLLRNALALGLPMACGAVLLLIYNRLRFDDWFEVGISYQVTTLKFRMSPRYWLTNIYSYALRPFFATCQFPYAIAPAEPGLRAFPPDMKVPDGYLLIEPVVGWLRAAPLTWLMLLVPFVVAERLRLLRALGPSARGAGAEPALDAKARTLLWLVACLCVVGSISGVPAFGLYMATMRYLADFSNALLLLGIIGGFSLYSWAARTRFRWLSGLLFGAPALVTITVGLLLGYQGYIGHFKTFNPELNAKLVNALSVCEAPWYRALESSLGKHQ